MYALFPCSPVHPDINRQDGHKGGESGALLSTSGRLKAFKDSSGEPATSMQKPPMHEPPPCIWISPSLVNEHKQAETTHYRLSM